VAVRVIFYGRLKQDTGVKTLDLPLDKSKTVGGLVARLVDSYPALAAQLGTVAFTIGAELVSPEHPVQDGDELGLLPPVSGG
jgi:molybdopterin converting factor small subunit